MEKHFTCIELDPMPLLLPEPAVWSRLGRNRFLSRIDSREETAVRLIMQQAFDLCRPRGRWCLVKVENVSSDSVKLAGFNCWHSAAFAEFTGQVPYLWLGAVTVGKEICQAAAEKQTSDMRSAAIYDAVGSESADAAIGVLQKHAAGMLSRSGLQLDGRRFSPGYGALALSVQQEIFARLELEELGMTLTERFIMQPEKSVTALAKVFQ